MAEPRAKARLSGERIVGVDVAGSITIVLGIAGVPTPLWADMVMRLDDRPPGIADVTFARPDAAPAQAPVQIELRVCSSDDIFPALEWLVAAIAHVNDQHDVHERRLAAIYGRALDTVNRWFDTLARPSGSPQDPALN